MIKICGITNAADARQAVEAGAGALGINFWPRSPRFCPVQSALGFVPSIPEGVLRVGVFVNESAETIGETCRLLHLDVAQLHGTCQPPPGVRTWKAIAVDVKFASAALDDPAHEAFLVDAPAGQLHGGSGRVFDWNLVRGAGRPIVLAGGLGPDNVARAIATARPWGVDACSRLEAAPGIKDHQKVAAFISAARRATESLQP